MPRLPNTTLSLQNPLSLSYAVTKQRSQVTLVHGRRPIELVSRYQRHRLSQRHLADPSPKCARQWPRRSNLLSTGPRRELSRWSLSLSELHSLPRDRGVSLWQRAQPHAAFPNRHMGRECLRATKFQSRGSRIESCMDSRPTPLPGLLHIETPRCSRSDAC